MKHIVYQMLPRLWGNGRFSGVDDGSLAYLKGLGVDAVWYTGVIAHATTYSAPGCPPPSNPQIVKGAAGSPYAIRDYYDVNAYLADCPARRMEEFESLVERTHSHGMKVIIDFVPNHVSRDYFSAAAPSGVRSLGQDDDKSVHWAPENDFFYYPGEPLALEVPGGDNPFQEYPAKASGNVFSPSPSVNDWYETVRINYCDFCTSTWRKMLDIVLFWASMGVDGFRCDMVEMVPWEFMKWLVSGVKSKFPETLFIAEVYIKEKYRMYLKEVGFDLLYDKSGLYDTLRSVTCAGTSARAISYNWQMLGDLQGGMINFLENHDEQRIASDFFCGDPRKGYAALAVSLLLNDASFLLYFGEEVGERGMDEEEFSGIDGRTSIFDWCKVGSVQRLCKWIQTGKGLLSEESSVLERYRSLLKMAKEPEFTTGKTYDLGYCLPSREDRVSAFLRSDGKAAKLVVANFSEASTISINIPSEAYGYLGVEGGLNTIRVEEVGSMDFAIIDPFSGTRLL